MENVETVAEVVESKPEAGPNALELFKRFDDTPENKDEAGEVSETEAQNEAEEETSEDNETEGDGSSSEDGSEPGAPIPTKLVKAINGDTELEIPEGAKFKVADKDGKEIEFTVKEAVNSFKTSRQIDRDLSRLDLERKALTTDKEFVKKAREDIEIIDKNINLIAQEAKKGNIMGVTQIVLNMAGGNNSEIVKQLVQQAEELTEQFAGMTPEERAAHIDRQQLLLERNALLAEKSQMTEKETRQDLKNFVHNIKDTYQMTDEDLARAFTKLESRNHRFPEEAKDVAKDCANWVLAERQFDKIVSAIESVSPARKEDTALIDAIANLVETDFTQQDIADIVSGYLGTKVSASSTTRQNSNKEVSVAANQNGVASKQKANPQRANGVANAGKSGGKSPILSYKDIIAKYED